MIITISGIMPMTGSQRMVDDNHLGRLTTAMLAG